ATRALELLEQYQTQLNATEDAKLRAAIERVIRIFKSKLFNALVEIQEFYEVTLLDENKSLEQKAMETQRVADRWADGPQSANGPTRQQKKPAAPSSPPLPPPDSSVGAFEVVLRRLAGQGFGFSIAGGVDEPHQPGDSRLFVTKVAPGGVAESDGRMSVGDVILAVNGVDVTSVSHEAAVSALKMSGAQLSLLMLRPPPQPQPALKPTAEAAPLPAEPPHLPGDDSIFVTKVIDGGAAQHSGRIGFGDRLLAVDGRPLTACTHQEAVATLKATGDRVRL
uniref:Disks large 1 tumor suppressor protein n=1 Tax=Macrostomum lignano TaxID=282301 RepID=A0A1I8GJG1_9PLAT